MSILGSVCSFVSSVFSSAVETFSNGVSLVVDGLSGIARAIGDGIKEICDRIGTEGMLLIGSIALAILIPGFGLPELLTIIQIVAKIAEILNVGGEDSPEEIGMKSEISDRKPDDFESIEEYIKYLNENVTLEPGAVENLSNIEKVRYGALGAAIEIKAIQEKYNIELSPDFLRDVTLMKLSGEEVGNFVKDFSEKGITKMQDMTDYLREKPIESEKSKVYSSMLDTMKSLYPELNDEQLHDKLDEMESLLKDSDI